MIRTGMAAILVALVLAGCVSRGGAGPELHSIHIRAHPDNALVSVRNPQRVVVAVVSQPGPEASFDLPQGQYRYSVTAEGYLPYEGGFAIPQNQNLEVWLQPR